MKLNDAIRMADALRDNAIAEEQKVIWINELEMKIQSLILRTAPHDMIIYTETDGETELLVPRPFDKVYYLWLAAMIDYGNAEYDKYQNDKAMADAAYSDYAKWFMRHFHDDCGNVMYIGGTTKYGLSAYQIAVNHGFEGTEEEWLFSLNGKDAYTVAVEKGYEGTEAEFYAQLGVLNGIEERASADAAAAEAAAERAETATQGLDAKVDAAETAAKVALNAAQSVVGAETNAVDAANRAETAAADVEQAVSDAAGAVREQVAEDANRAEQAAETAENAADTAAQDAAAQVEQNLGSYVTNAQNAAQDAEDAKSAAQTAQAAAEKAAQEAAGAAGGGVTSFNGRSGVVNPQKGDYNAEHITFSDGETFQQKYDSGELKGEDGKSAYKSAQDGGYTGTEEQFNQDLSMIGEKEVFVATVTKTTADGVTTYASDKTALEIAAARGAGKFVVARFQTQYFTVASCAVSQSPPMARFVFGGMNGLTYRSITIYSIQSTGVTTVTVAETTALNEAGDTLTGALTLAGDPTADLHAATKQYVDNTAQTKITGTAGDTVVIGADGTPTAQPLENTDYATVRARGICIVADEAVSVPNGCLCGVYTVS